MLKFTKFIVIIFIASCKPLGTDTSQLAVINGKDVTDPKSEAPGIYQMRVWVKGDNTPWRGTGIQSGNVLLTASHLANRRNIERIELIDNSNKVFHEFNPNSNNVQYLNNGDNDIRSMGAFVFNGQVPSGSHGSAYLAKTPPTVGQKINIVGAGIADARMMNKINANSREQPVKETWWGYGTPEVKDWDWGKLRTAENTIRKDSNGMIEYWGTPFKSEDPQKLGKDGSSGQADSGGGILTFSKNKPVVAGMIQGGNYNYKKSYPANAKFEDRVYDTTNYATDLTSKDSQRFFKQIEDTGGQLLYEER